MFLFICYLFYNEKYTTFWTVCFLVVYIFVSIFFVKMFGFLNGFLWFIPLGLFDF